MPGEQLAATALRLLHQDTFQLVVSPAIADLQYETSMSNRAGTARGYMAVWLAIAGALFLDLERDVRAVLDDSPTLVSLAILQASYYAAMLSLLGDSLNASTSATLLGALLAVSTLSTAVLFWPARRRDA